MIAGRQPPAPRPLWPAEPSAHGDGRDGASIVVPVYYDFASSLCHVAHRVMGRMQPVLEELDVRLEWIPIDLAALVGWRRGHPVSELRRRHVRQVADALRVPLTIPVRWIESRPLGALALYRHGVDRARGTCSEATLREFVFTRIFDEGRVCLSQDESRRLAAELGFDLDDDALAEAQEALEAWTRHAADAMVTGVPTFMLGPWPFGGIQEDATMDSILRRWARKLRAPGDVGSERAS